MRRLLRFLDFLFLTRPVLFFPVWTVFFAGMVVASIPQFSRLRADLWLAVQSLVLRGEFWLAFLSVSAAMAAVFVINQFTDVKSDRENNKLFLLANGMVSRKAASLEAAGLAAAALIFAAPGPRSFPGLTVLILLITGAGYSLRPFSWKDRPLPGLFVNMTGALLTFAYGWRVVRPLDGQMLRHSVPYLLAVGAVYLLTTILDRKGDRAIGKYTFAVRYGVRATVWWAFFFELACMVCAALLADPVIFIPAVLAAPFFVRLLRDAPDEKVVPATRIPILLLSLTVAVMFPLHFVLMAGVYFLSKWYYRERFRLHYPSLTQIVEES
ncbi:MAG TPA: hypothetical protein ENJ23_04135 [Bacteroidetes bacterium]|nr:hypothetical protein [Bacteroidota bacterium]